MMAHKIINDGVIPTIILGVEIKQNNLLVIALKEAPSEDVEKLFLAVLGDKNVNLGGRALEGYPEAKYGIIVPINLVNKIPNLIPRLIKMLMIKDPDKVYRKIKDLQQHDIDGIAYIELKLAEIPL